MVKIQNFSNKERDFIGILVINGACFSEINTLLRWGMQVIMVSRILLLHFDINCRKVGMNIINTKGEYGVKLPNACFDTS
jgi:hypothetical protein